MTAKEQSTHEASLVAQEAAKEAAKAAAISATNAAIVSKDIEYIKRDLAEIKASVKELVGVYVTQDEFKTVRNIVYGMVALIITGVFGAMVNMVISK